MVLNHARLPFRHSGAYCAYAQVVYIPAAAVSSMIGWSRPFSRSNQFNFRTCAAVLSKVIGLADVSSVPAADA